MGEFETLFQQFLRDGGFARPCFAEFAERDQRQRQKHVPQKCIHGLTALTCAECNLSGFQPDREWGS